MTQAFSGGCSCGAVRYECTAAPVNGVHCHCRECQKASGAGHMSMIIIHNEALTITGEVKFFDYEADSGGIARNGFCPNCGSQLLGMPSGAPGIMAVRVGSLDDPSWFKPGMTVYAASAQPWDTIDPAVPSHPGLP